MSAHDAVNILMVDDQPGKLLSYEAILHPLGENLLKANSGRDALDSLLRNDIAVVLMDVSMPGMNGLDATRILRREIPRIDVILVSQNDPKIVSRQAAEVGAQTAAEGNLGEREAVLRHQIAFVV